MRLLPYAASAAHSLCAALLALTLTASACSGDEGSENLTPPTVTPPTGDGNDEVSASEKPVFTSFAYTGNDAIYSNYPLASDEFYSPILQGCYPDPSICRKGNDYYLINSSFSYYPGIPVFHSTDLVNWKQIGHVMHDQLKLTGLGMENGVYAPDISYNPNNQTFYVVTTHIGGNLGNIVMKATNPAGPWSAAIKLNFNGIDPAMFFDDDGKAYIVHNGDPDVNVYGSAHKAARLIEYDLATDQVKGDDIELVSGGVNIAESPSWLEGPHIYKKNGKYYLMCAEGGTGPNHREVIFSSPNLKGPYTPAAVNPILTQKGLPWGRADKVDATGHADLVQTPGGAWYGVFLAVRPNTAYNALMGRETFILPVDWSGEFPVFSGGLVALTPKVKLPAGTTNQTGRNGYLPNANFTYTDTFNASQLSYDWISIRGAYTFASLSSSGVKLEPANVKIAGSKSAPSAICYRQRHNSFNAKVGMLYKPKAAGDLAGVSCFYNESNCYVCGLTYKSGEYYMVLEKTDQGVSSVVATAKVALPADETVHLRIRMANDDLYFDYSVTGNADNNFITLGGKQSSGILHSGYAGGFTGNVIALYATKVNTIVP